MVIHFKHIKINYDTRFFVNAITSSLKNTADANERVVV